MHMAINLQIFEGLGHDFCYFCYFAGNLSSMKIFNKNTENKPQKSSQFQNLHLSKICTYLLLIINAQNLLLYLLAPL